MAEAAKCLRIQHMFLYAMKVIDHGHSAPANTKRHVNVGLRPVHDFFQFVPVCASGGTKRGEVPGVSQVGNLEAAEEGRDTNLFDVPTGTGRHTGTRGYGSCVFPIPNRSSAVDCGVGTGRHLFGGVDAFLSSGVAEGRSLVCIVPYVCIPEEISQHGDGV